jgi:hypothetical protein
LLLLLLLLLPPQAMAIFRTLVGFGIPGAVVAFNLLLELTPTRYCTP